MNWIKIIAFLLPAIISIGTFYSTKQEKPKWVRNLCVLIVISTIVGIVLERRDNHSKNKEQNDLKQQNKLQIEEIRSLKDRMIAFQTLNTLMPGNEPDPPTTFRDKPPADAIKLYLGSCLAWWKSKGTHTRSLVTINNEPVLTLGLEENGLFLSGKIRRPEDGREVMNLINNKFVRNPNVVNMKSLSLASQARDYCM